MKLSCKVDELIQSLSSFQKMASSGKCEVCKKSTKALCPGCNKVFYCSEDHQESDWNNHKQCCKPFMVGVAKVLQHTCTCIVVFVDCRWGTRWSSPSSHSQHTSWRDCYQGRTSYLGTISNHPPGLSGMWGKCEPRQQRSLHQMRMASLR